MPIKFKKLAKIISILMRVDLDLKFVAICNYIVHDKLYSGAYLEVALGHAPASLLTLPFRKKEQN